jgi:hypothetical protein
MRELSVAMRGAANVPLFQSEQDARHLIAALDA